MVATLTPTVDLTATSTPAIVETPTSEPTVAPTAAASNEPTATAIVDPTPTEYTFQGYRDTVTKYLDRLKPTNLTEADLRRIFESSLYRQKLEDDITKDLKPFKTKFGPTYSC